YYIRCQLLRPDVSRRACRLPPVQSDISPVSPEVAFVHLSLLTLPIDRAGSPKEASDDRVRIGGDDRTATGRRLPLPRRTREAGPVEQRPDGAAHRGAAASRLPHAPQLWAGSAPGIAHARGRGHRIERALRLQDGL